tara:strand:- start:226 stop:1002 length:777 start_codon:yes stop_codon:yes gene_type:complete
MPIPKIIHYCWFGPKSIPELEKKCIETWTKHMPEYKLMFWNEDTFDISINTFAKQAYDNKYYAFVSDFVRAYALSKYGGIYLDTDVEVLSNFSHLLDGKDAVLGFENTTQIGTALMAFIPNHKIIKSFSAYYENLRFITTSGKLEITANPSILRDILRTTRIQFNGEEQEFDNIHVYKRDVFFPKLISDTEFRTTENTIAIHHFRGSWLTDSQKKRGRNKIWIKVCRPILKKFNSTIILVLGEKKSKSIEVIVRNWLK